MHMIVDCDQNPLVLEGFMIAHHIPVELQSIEHIVFWKAGRCLPNSFNEQTAHGILEEIRSLNPANGCVLDYLLENQHRIPDRLDKALFWGTGFRSSTTPGLYLQRLVKTQDAWRRQLVRISAETPLLIYGAAVWLCSK